MGASINIMGTFYNPIPQIDPITIRKKLPDTQFTLNLTGHVLDRIEEIKLVGDNTTGSTVTNIVSSFTTLSFDIMLNSVEQIYQIEFIYPEGSLFISFEAVTPNWVDLRLGGNILTIGTETGNDIRHASVMTPTRDPEGLYFAGANPWTSWVKVELLRWQRGENLTCEWIFTNPDANMMIGIGSDATNETSGTQFSQAEVQTYFTSGTNQWGLYGNSGTIGSAANDNFNTTVTTGGVFKIRFENDGSAGGQYTLFQLPSADPSDWNDESNVLVTRVIGGGLNPDELNIMPFIIPRNRGTQRFIAVKVD